MAHDDPTASGPDQALTAVGAAVVIPAFDEELRVAQTVAAARRIPGVDLVVVVDDGSTDATSEVARAAGALVVRQQVNAGKAAAMERGADAVQAAEVRAGVPSRPLLFLDADLEATAAQAAVLLPPVLAGEVDMTIATLPSQPGGGRGFVVRLASDGIVEATGWRPTQPLSGQRALTRAAFDAARPLARGFGVEVGLTIDLLRAGYRVSEVPVELRHRVTGTDLRAQLHRGRQFWAVWRALRSRGVGPVLPVPR